MRTLSLFTAVSLPAALALGCADHGDVPTAAELSAAPLAQHAHAAGNVPSARNFVAPLAGDQENPPVDTRARGLAELQLEADDDALHYRLIVANIQDVLMAHIHRGPAGENGPIVVWLYPPDGPQPSLIPGRTDGELATGTITEDDLIGPLAGGSLDDLLDQIRSGNAYVNVHTSAHPGGEIRGQVAVAGPSH